MDGSLMRTHQRTRPGGLRQSPHLLEALQVAYYHCVLQMPLKDIAKVLGKSPATITRRLDEVRQAGWLHDRPEFIPPPEIWRELQGRMTCAEVENALLDHFGRDLLQRVTVLHSPVRPEGMGSREARPENVERVGLYAANRLSEALSEGAHVVGINWGWTVRHCVTNLHPVKPNPNLRIVPLVGSLSLDESDPHFEEAIDCSSNRLAHLAATAFEAPRPPRLNTPAYIPRRFTADAQGLRYIREFITSDISYRRIFGGRDEKGVWQPGFIEQMDTLVTGLTSLDVLTLPTYRPNLITPEDLPVLQRAGVVGDLGLHLLVESEPDTEECPSSACELVKSINGLIVGAAPQDFVSVAERARRGEAQGPGVMVVASGPWKARILTTAICLRAVNELITDLETALAICRHVGIKLPSSLKSLTHPAQRLPTPT